MIELPDYKLNEEIFQAYHSFLYRGTRKSDNKPVLIETFLTEFDTPIQAAQFRQEFSIIKNLKSEGFIKSYDTQNFRDGLALILEDFPGEPLYKNINILHNDIIKFLFVAIQLTKALSEIHHANIIHKEIKPKNIFLNQDTCVVKFIGPGFSSILTRENEHIYNPDVLNDSLPYISPEQTGRMNRTVDYRTDFYSLGVVFYELITGTLPFYSDNPLELFHSHIAITPEAPSRSNSDIPEAISDIIIKMLSKNPEDRYQSAHGLKADLEECLNQIETTGRIKPFLPGANDISDKLNISQKIYGRDKEISILMAAFDRVCQGTSELMLVSGYAGIGKTALINEIHKPIVQQKGYFISGKFDSLQLNRPYSAIIQAFKDLIRQILSEDQIRIKKWKDQFNEGLGNNGRIITDVIPELKLIIGEQPEVQALGPEEYQNRFNLVFRAFVNIIAKSRHALVIFLDDLQWADSASLNLLDTLMSFNSAEYIFYICAFRNNEFYWSHHVKLWIDKIGKAEVKINEISLQPIDLEHMNYLISNTLRCTHEISLPLSELVFQKTGGNPFFLKQFMTTLYDEKALSFQNESGWQWDLDRIKMMHITDNVVDLMIAKILKHPKGPQNAFKYASVIGNMFDLEMLAEIVNKCIDDTYADLSDPLNNGLIILWNDRCKFAHDRIQEAVYSLIPDEDKSQIHYKIGNFLMQRTNSEDFQERIFSIVDHFNKCLDIIIDEQKRTELASLNLRAGERAKSSTAYASAVKYLEYAVLLLPESSWVNAYDLTFSIYSKMAECKYLNSKFQEAEKLFDEILIKAVTNLDKVKIYSQIIELYTNQSRYHEALDMGRRALKLLKFNLPHSPGRLSIMLEFIRAKINMTRKEIEDMIDLPELKDPDKLAIMSLLYKLVTPSWWSKEESHKNFFPYIILKIVNISIKHGNSKFSSFAYTSYGSLLCFGLGKYESGYKFGKMGIRLNSKFNNIEIKAKIYHFFGALISYWREHIDESIEYENRAFQHGIENGDIVSAAYAKTILFQNAIRKGIDLDSIISIYKATSDFIKMTKYDEIINIYTSLYRMILPYKGLTVHSSTYSDEYFDEIQFVQQLKDQRVATLDFCYTKVQSLYMTGNYDEALKYADIIFKDFEEGNFGLIYIPEFCFYHTLSLSAHYDSVNKQDKKQYLKIINKNIRKMKVWADNSPDNFLHQYLIMAAELSRIKENDLEAMMLYSQAVKTSQENDYNNHEAIANDLAARFYLSKENKTAAKAYMSEALKCYSKWGATAIVADRRLKYQSLLPEETDGTKPVTTLQSYQPISPSTIIDHVSVVSSLQAISSEIFMENLLKTLMKIVMENSGAQRCIYISLKNDNLFVEAEMSVGSNQVILSENGLLEEKDDLLISVVYYVKRTLQHIVLDDATKEKDYLTDPYVLKSQSKSILCLPVIRQQILVGILYLENNITARAFVPERIEVLKLLASQAAISLENVMLVEDMQKKESGLKESEEKYRSLVQYATDLIMHLDIEGNIQFINHTPLGVKKEDVIGKNVLDFTSNEFHGEIQEAHKYVLKSGEPDSYEFLGNVTNKWYSTIISPIIKDGEIIALTLVARDISLRKKAEEKYRTLVEQSNDGIAIGQDECFKYVNPSLAKMIGYTVDEMTGTHISEYFEPDKIALFLDRHRRRQAGEDLESIYEAKFRHKDGHYIDVETSFSLTEYENKPAVLVFFRDITDRKQLENELIAKERLLNFAIEQLPIPVGIANAPDADLSILNQAAIDLMVKPLDNYKELIINEHRELWPSFHPDGTPYTTDELPLIRAIQEGHITRNEEVILRRNDGDRWVSGSAAPLIDEDGKIIAAICAFPDITELKRAEEAIIRQKEEETKALTIEKERKELMEWVNTFDTFVAKYDIDGNMYYCNESALWGTGVTEDEVYGKYFPDMVFWSHSDAERSKIVECFKKAKAGISSRIETNFEGANGSHVPIIFNCQPVLNEKGEVKYITAEGIIIIEQVRLLEELQNERESLEVRVRERTKELKDLNIELSREIAERTKAEEELRSSEERYRNLFNNNHSIMLMIDPETADIVDANPAACSFYGYSHDDLLNKRITDINIFSDEQVFQEMELARSMERMNLFFQHKLANDEIRDVEVHSGVINFYGRELLYSIIYDISERKQTERELTKYREHLEDIVAERTKELEEAHEKLLTAERLATLGQLSGSISHEIRNPLSIIDSSAYYLKMKLPDTDSKIHQHIDRIKKSVKRSTAIIESLLNLTRMKEPIMGSINVALLVDDTLTSITQPEQINVIVNIPDDFSIKGDYELIRMVFKNIIKNAFDAMKHDGRLTIIGNKADDGRVIQIMFEDTGPGITSENIEKIFQPLFSTKTIGIGFGLTICQQVIERHGGVIDVTSEPGQGAVFTVRLPSCLGHQ